VTSCCEYGNELMGAVMEFLDHLSDHPLLKDSGLSQ
jgi:hypothetical protein